MTNLLDLSRDLPVERIPAGTALVREGEATGTLHVLVEGQLDVLRNGVPINVVDVPGAVVGEMSVLLGVPPTATVIARTDVSVRVAHDGAAFLSSDPEIGLLVARTIAERLNLVTTYLADLRRQYGGTGTQLGLVDEVLSSIMNLGEQTAEPGSERDPDPLY